MLYPPHPTPQQRLLHPTLNHRLQQSHVVERCELRILKIPSNPQSGSLNLFIDKLFFDLLCHTGYLVLGRAAWVEASCFWVLVLFGWWGKGWCANGITWVKESINSLSCVFTSTMFRVHHTQVFYYKKNSSSRVSITNLFQPPSN